MRSRPGTPLILAPGNDAASCGAVTCDGRERSERPEQEKPEGFRTGVRAPSDAKGSRWSDLQGGFLRTLPKYWSHKLRAKNMPGTDGPSVPVGVSVMVYLHHEPIAAFAATVPRTHAAHGSIGILQEFPPGTAPGACLPQVIESAAAAETLTDDMDPRVGGNNIPDVILAPAEWAGSRRILPGMTGFS